MTLGVSPAYFLTYNHCLPITTHEANAFGLSHKSPLYKRRAGETPAFPGRKLQKQKPVAMVLSAKSK
jgi:hypothetical protein